MKKIRKMITSKNFKNFVTFVKETFHLLFAALLILGLFYLRLLPRISRDLYDTMTNYQILRTSLSVFLLLINIYMLLRLLELLPNKQKFEYASKILEIFSSVSNYISWTLKNLYMFFWQMAEWVVWKIFKYEKLAYNVIRKLAKIVLLAKPKYIFWFLITIKFIPKILFVIVFSYDVFYANQLSYTFKFIPWLLLPLLEKFFVFIFENFYDYHWEGISSFVLEKETENPNLAAYSFISEYQGNPPHFVTDFFDFFNNHFEVLINIKQLILEYNIWKYDIFPYFHLQLLLSVIRIFAFFYMLFCGLT